MSTVSDVRNGTSYDFRRYRSGDELDFLALFETVHREPRGREWFQWRYEQNPYLDHVPMFVAEADGDVVGVRPYLGVRMRVGGATVTALLTVDTMVHPDHRRRGLFTTMTERSLAFYAGRAPAFVFNQPNAASRPGFLDLGWYELDRMTTYYRLQNPGRLLSRRVDAPVPGPVSRAASGLATGALGIRDRLSPPGDGATVTRREGVADDVLASLYRSNVPAGIHALRDETFYRWRFASPAWSRSTYVATVDEDRVAGAVVRTRTRADGVTVAQVADVVPLAGSRQWRSGLAAIVGRVLDDQPDADVVAAPARVFPGSVASSFGFLPDDRFPLSRVSATDCRLCVRPLTGDAASTVSADGASAEPTDGGPSKSTDGDPLPATGDGSTSRAEDGSAGSAGAAPTVAGVALTDPDNWTLSFAERDTA